VNQWCEFKFVEGRQKYCQLIDLILILFGLIFGRIYIYINYPWKKYDDNNIRPKIKPNSIRIRSMSWQYFCLPSTGFELTPLIHCNTNRLILCPAPKTTLPHPLLNILKCFTLYQVTIIPSYLYSEMREFKIFKTSHFVTWPFSEW
jgi:hypothetical protein